MALKAIRSMLVAVLLTFGAATSSDAHEEKFDDLVISHP